MRRNGWMSLSVLSLCTAFTISAQTARDTSHATLQKAPIDDVTVFLKRYCGLNPNSQVSYSKPACRNYKKLAVSESALVATPAIVIIPVDTTHVIVPVDTTTHVIVTVDTAQPKEPVFDSTKATMVMKDNLDGYTNSAALLPPCVYQLPAPRFYNRWYDYCATGMMPDTITVSIIAGRNGSGHAARLIYYGSDLTTTAQESRNVTAGGFGSTGMNTVVITTWQRVTGPLGSIKWIELFHASAPGRLQFNTHDHLPCAWPGIFPNQFSWVWQVYDQKETACQANQPVGPTPDQIGDGQWHRFTYLYKPNSAPGARDGRALMWIDGKLIIRIEKSAIDVTPTGGVKTWCGADDVDGIASDGFIEANFGGPLTYVRGPFTVDIDDFQMYYLRSTTVALPSRNRPAKPTSAKRIPLRKDPVRKP